MKKNILKKVVVSTAVLCGLCITITNVAYASSVFATISNTKNLAGSDKWNRGIQSKSAGWYMPYSYYNNNVYSHNASVYTTDGNLKSTVPHSPGMTASINAKSSPNLANAYTRAGIQLDGGKWKYTHDSGSGEY